MHRPATLHALQSVENKIDTEAIAALRRGIFRTAEQNGSAGFPPFLHSLADSQSFGLYLPHSSLLVRTRTSIAIFHLN